MGRVKFILITMLSCMILFGCVSSTGEELLGTPRPPAYYLNLQKQIDKIHQSGLDSVAPEEGPNRHSVQFVDFDGDGEEEAVSFFKDSANGCFKVYIHKKIGEEYIEMGSVKGSGTSIDSVFYPRFGANGSLGIVICWRLAGKLDRGMTVCELQNGRFMQLLDVEYSNIVITDLNDDGIEEIITTVFSKLDGHFSARYYVYENDNIKMVSETPLSSEIKSIAKIKKGNIDGFNVAAFIDGNVESGGLVTDVLCENNGILQNITFDDVTGSGKTTYRPVSAFSDDVDGDGVTEIPVAVILPGYDKKSGDERQWRLTWRDYKKDGSYTVKMNTYHNFAEKWYIKLKNEWLERVTVKRENETNGQCTVFMRYDGGGHLVPFLKIHSFTGDDKKTLAGSHGFIQLGESQIATYSAEILDGAIGDFSLNEQQLKNIFRITPVEWSSEEN